MGIQMHVLFTQFHGHKQCILSIKTLNNCILKNWGMECKIGAKQREERFEKYTDSLKNDWVYLPLLIESNIHTHVVVYQKTQVLGLLQKSSSHQFKKGSFGPCDQEFEGSLQVQASLDLDAQTRSLELFLHPWLYFLLCLAFILRQDFSKQK